MRKIPAVIGLIFCLAFLAGCGEAQSSYDAAAEYYRNGDYSEALEHFRLAMSQGMKDPAVKADIALCFAKLDDPYQGGSYMSGALVSGGESARVLKRAGIFYMILGEDEKALDYLNRSITTPEASMSVADLETCAFAAEIEERNGCLDEAIRLYDLLITQGYYPMEHQFMAGLAYLKLSQTDAAEQYFSLAAAHEEAPAEYFLRIYQGYTEAGEPARADKWFQAGLSHITEGGSITEAAYYAQAGRMTEAMSLFAGETSSTGLLSYAKCLMTGARYEEAEKVIQELLAKGEQLPRAYFRYFVLKVLENNVPDSRRLLTQIRSYGEEELQEPTDWNEIILYERTGDYDTAFDRMIEYRKNYDSDESVLREYAFLSRVAAAGGEEE